MVTGSSSGISDWNSAVSPELKAVGHPIVDNFPDTWVDNTADTGRRILSWESGVVPVAYHTNASYSTNATILLAENSAGGAWVHIQDGFLHTTTAGDAIFKTILDYLSRRTDRIRSWRDRIQRPSFIQGTRITSTIIEAPTISGDDGFLNNALTVNNGTMKFGKGVNGVNDGIYISSSNYLYSNDTGKIAGWAFNTAQFSSSTAAGGADGSFTTAGIIINSAGWISAPNFALGSTNRLSSFTFTDEVLNQGGKIYIGDNLSSYSGNNRVLFGE